ncbi:MAG: CoA pyrophosphatase [Candidatus Dormibacteraeota bacterium]|nr:CoA pyrophosphatase [Candidatus Dormibacteraeota bacterium]
MTQRVKLSPRGSDELVARFRNLLLPLDATNSFRAGARPAAVTLLLFERGGEWRAPFVKRRSDLTDHPGQVGLPGGGVHPGEGAWHAAARELEEEIGVRQPDIRPLGAGPRLYASVTNFEVAPFVAVLSRRDPSFTLERGELEALIEVPVQRLLDPSAWLQGPLPWPGRHLPVDGAEIWGLTSRLLDDLLPALGAAFERP